MCGCMQIYIYVILISYKQCYTLLRFSYPHNIFRNLSSLYAISFSMFSISKKSGGYDRKIRAKAIISNLLQSRWIRIVFHANNSAFIFLCVTVRLRRHQPEKSYIHLATQTFIFTPSVHIVLAYLLSSGRIPNL